MAAGNQPVASGVTQFVVFSIAPVLLLWLVLHTGAIVRFARRAVSGLRAVRPPLRLAGPPLEQTAADIRRIAAGIRTMPAQAPLAQRHGALLAYDDALVAACRALGVEERLHGMPLGPARDAERLRIECELMYEGLVIGTARGVIRTGGGPRRPPMLPVALLVELDVLDVSGIAASLPRSALRGDRHELGFGGIASAKSCGR